MKHHILVVEDDEIVAEALSELLEHSHYQVSLVSTSEETLSILQTTIIDLIILDVHLNLENGFDLCRKIRENYDLPILFLTACSSETELVQGFTAGGDDYVTKPFRMQELLVRIQALLRRTASQVNTLKKSGNLIYDERLKQFSRSNIPLDLTLTELRLACCLMEHYPNLVTREHLFYEVWDQYNAFVDANTLNVNMSRLREKLGTYQDSPYIQTSRGLGYRWSIPVQK